MAMEREVQALLRAWGVDRNETRVRFLEDEAFYMQCLRQFADDPTLTRLEQSIRGNDPGAVLDDAYGVLGAAANLGLKVPAQTIRALTQQLENNDLPAARQSLAALQGQQKSLKAALAGEAVDAIGRDVLS